MSWPSKLYVRSMWRTKRNNTLHSSQMLPDLDDLNDVFNDDVEELHRAKYYSKWPPDGLEDLT